MEFDHRFCLYKTPWSTQLAMKTDEKSLFLLSFLYFFGENGIGFGKCEFGNGIRICGYTETNKYG
jgi:hypothetical protein